ncbi:large tegument protein uL36 [Caudoviricetes sp.]|nr:large tegument protein uL36 [Caudoviricetes sp.]
MVDVQEEVKGLDDLYALREHVNRQMRQLESATHRTSQQDEVYRRLLHVYQGVTHDFEEADSTYGSMPWYQKWRTERLGPMSTQPRAAAAAPESPGLMSKVFKGLGDTAGMVAHPGAALANVGSGVVGALTLPNRAIESAQRELGLRPHGGPGPASALQEGVSDWAKGVTERAGVPKESYGPAVVESVSGAMALPIPAQKGQALLDFLYSGGAGAGYALLEDLSETGAVSPERVGASGLISGGLGALLGRFARRAPHTAGAESSPTGPAGGAPRHPGGPPRLLEAPPQPGEVRGGTVYGEPPRLALPAPEATPEADSAMRRFMSRYNLRQYKREPVVPPSAKGALEQVMRPEDAVRSRAAAEVATPPASPPYPGSIYGMPGVKTPAQLEAEAEAKVAVPVAKGKRTRVPAGDVIDVTPEGVAVPRVEPKAVAKRAAKTEKSMADVEADLADIIKGLKPAGAVQPKEPPRPKSKPLAVEGEAKGQAVVPPDQSAKFGKSVEAAPFVEKVKPVVRLEKVLKDHSFQAEVFEDPLHGTRYRVYDKAGNLRAAGDRSDILNAIQQGPEGKGIKLASGLGGIEEPAALALEALRKQGSKVASIADSTFGSRKAFSRYFKPGRRFGAEHPSMAEAMDELFDRHAAINQRARDFLYKHSPEGEFSPTGYYHYDTLPKESLAKVNKILWYGDKNSIDLSKPEYHAILAKQGVTPQEMVAIDGVRQAFKTAREDTNKVAAERIKGGLPLKTEERALVEEMGTREGFLPHTWEGRWEVYRNGTKDLHPGPEGSVYDVSGYKTQWEAAQRVLELKAKDPKARVEIKFWGDRELPGITAAEEGLISGRIKRNLKLMHEVEGREYVSPELIDDALRYGRDIKGFMRHIEERKGAPGFATADLEVLVRNYLYRHSRFVEVSKARMAVRDILEHSSDLSGEQAAAVLHRLERFAGKPAVDEAFISQKISGTRLGEWLDPQSGGRAIQTVNQLTTHLTLGMGHVSYALVQLAAIPQHVWPALSREATQAGFGLTGGEKFLWEGIRGLGDKALRQKLAHAGVIDIQMMSEKIPQFGKTLLEKPVGQWTSAQWSMALSTITEEWSRAVAGIGRYKMALAQGWPEKEAIRAARHIVIDTLGEYSVIGKPMVLTGAIGGTVGRFKTFPLVMLSNGMAALRGFKDTPAASLRYFVANLGLAGIVGIPGAMLVNDYVERHYGFSPRQWAADQLGNLTSERFASMLMHGGAAEAGQVLGLEDAGIDLSSRAGLKDIFPDDVGSALGPVLGRFYNAMQALQRGGYEDAAEKLFIPSSLRGALQARKEGSLSYRDRPTIHYTPTERVIRATGFMPMRETAEREQAQTRKHFDLYRDERLKLLADRILDNPQDEKAYAEFGRLGGTSRILQNAAQARELEMLQRQDRALPKLLRRRGAESVVP